MKKRTKQDYWKGRGGFAGIPRMVMDSPDFKILKSGDKALLLEFCYQFRGKNNGDLTCAWSILKKRGFGSEDTIRRAAKRLLEFGFIELTRKGIPGKDGKRQCALYALTWQPIDEVYDSHRNPKLDIPSTTRPLRTDWETPWKEQEPSKKPPRETRVVDPANTPETRVIDLAVARENPRNKGNRGDKSLIADPQNRCTY